MSARTLLDADMQTLGRWLAQGVHWWLDELHALVPARLRRSRTGTAPRLRFVAGELVADASGNDPTPALPSPGTRAIVLVPQELCLTRTIVRPAISERDLGRMIVLEADALLPLPAGTAIVAVRGAAVAGEGGKRRIDLAGIARDKAQEIADAIVASGIRPVAVLLDELPGTSPPLDFMQAMHDAGLLPRTRSAAAFLWVLVGSLACANIAVSIWRDEARVARIEALVQEQQPAVGVAKTIGRRAEGDRRLIAQTLALRHSRDPLDAMAATGEALPPGAWLQRLVWEGSSVRLVGYRPARIDVATALRNSGRFAEVRVLADETQAAVAAGEPFDLTARIVPR